MTNIKTHVAILSSESYAELLIEVQRWYEQNGIGISVISDNFLSDRFSKRVYYFLTYQIEVE
tara:strand:+ start:79 stop:264 length:186 start_codon:yes stop_codon:yes gene_type:complete